ncbi:MAG: nucleoside diphosphate kinase regulator [Rhizobiales bacterium]|nr:nucleoside diphosphate kinase regulator [Hyphomicrobiales bacterium]
MDMAEVKALPPIALNASDFAQLQRLANAAAEQFPRTADFLAREVERARVVDAAETPENLVAMGSEVEFRDDDTGKVRRVTLVYPHQADIDSNRISVLSPIGAALVGLSVGQAIEFQGPAGGARSLTVLAVGAQAE